MTVLDHLYGCGFGYLGSIFAIPRVEHRFSGAGELLKLSGFSR